MGGVYMTPTGGIVSTYREDEAALEAEALTSMKFDAEAEAQALMKRLTVVTPEVAAGPPRLIGLCGKARSGKDTVGKMLKDYAGGDTISFAEPIRAALRSMMNLNDRHFHGDLKETVLGWIDKSPRQLMQLLGTEWGRDLVDTNLWLKLAKQQIAASHAEGRNAIVTDVRFENEATFIRENGGVIWHIVRDGAAVVNAHASEGGIKHADGDKVLYNYGDLEYLRKQVLFLF